ncbi:hypothetical protein [Rubrivirga sp. IMCC45206]|uniref:hypothetical protein n=1 Tax=Rubrivirga sp. IMCC45206 TaxID=3391614 RepID=UPI0039901F9E
MAETDDHPTGPDAPTTPLWRPWTFLGRLSKAVREQNWVAVALEVCIVVLGVVIGFQITAWGQARADHARERGYLERVHEDLLADTGALDARIAYYAGVTGFAEAAVAHVETGALRDGSPWATVVAYYHASQILPYASTRRTFDEMREAGDLRLVRDAALRAELGAYYNDTEVSQGGWLLQEVPAYRERVRGLTSLQVQRYVNASCSTFEGFDQVLTDCPAPISDTEARALLDRYRAAPGLAEDLRYWASTLGIVAVVLPINRAAAEALIARVAPPSP